VVTIFCNNYAIKEGILFMKKAILLYIFVFISIPLTGDSIDEYISKMQKSSPKEKVKMMDKLKQVLVKMNNAQRTKIIQELRAKNTQVDNQIIVQKQ
jgi:hypothetical protein